MKNTAEFIVLFASIVIVGFLLTLLNFFLFYLFGAEDKINSPIFYLILVLGWSLSITFIVSKIFKNDE